MKKIFYLFLVLLIVSCSKDKNMANVLFQVSGGDGSLNCIYEDDIFTLNKGSMLVNGCTISSPSTGEVVNFGVMKMLMPAQLNWNNILTNAQLEDVGILDFRTPSGRRIQLHCKQDSVNKASSYEIPTTGFYSFKIRGVSSEFHLRIKYYDEN